MSNRSVVTDMIEKASDAELPSVVKALKKAGFVWVCQSCDNINLTAKTAKLSENKRCDICDRSKP